MVESISRATTGTSLGALASRDHTFIGDVAEVPVEVRPQAIVNGLNANLG